MSVPERNAPVEEADLPRRWLWRLVGGRLVVAAVLLGLSALWSGGAGGGAPGAPQPGGGLPLARGGVGGRLVVAAVLLGLSALWSGGPAAGAQESHRLVGVLPLAGVVLALSAAFGAAF